MYQFFFIVMLTHYFNKGEQVLRLRAFEQHRNMVICQSQPGYGSCFVRQSVFSIRQAEVDNDLESIGGYFGKLRVVRLPCARQAIGNIK